MRTLGRLVAVAAMIVGLGSLGNSSAHRIEPLIGKWHGGLLVSDRYGFLYHESYTLWITSTKPGSMAGKSVDRPDPPCVGRLIAVGTSRGWTQFVDHRYRGPSNCTDRDRFAVRVTSDGRLRYRGRSTTGLLAVGLLKRNR